MKSIVVWNQKGGVGKTSLVVHLAWLFEELGKSVVVIDLDRQGNSSSTLSDYPVIAETPAIFDPEMNFGNQVEPAKAGIHLIRGGDGVADVERRTPRDVILAYRNNLAQLKSRFDICVVDTPPGQTLTVIAALVATDFVVMPFSPTQWAVDGVIQALKTCTGVKEKFNERLTLLGILAWLHDPRVSSQKAILEGVAEKYPSLIFPLKVGQRAAIGDVASIKKPVWTNRAAAKAGLEVRAAVEQIASKVLDD